MSVHIKFYQRAGVRKWFLLALLFGCLFLVLTAFYASGVINRATLEVERWLIGRPLTQFDCVLVEWRNFGGAIINLVFIAIVGIVCGITYYRWRVLPYLLILILISVAIEEIGKNIFSLPVSLTMHSGMASLTCPQEGQSRLQHLQLGLGMWWLAPLSPRGLQDWAHTVSQMPINTNLAQLLPSHSYPSGHAIRWWFTGLLVAWLLWKHIKSGIARWLLVILTLILCFFGAAIQFYIGAHFMVDTLAGYLVGTSLACCAIGLLVLNEKKRKDVQLRSDSPLQGASLGDVHASKMT
ncbi:MAG TPA: phosphatase PAP2 family protein [Ktedonobacteraceae bacterium]|nr:phosphatase PAP2 family protein [Ktedonobacteraceae bacterium]